MEVYFQGKPEGTARLVDPVVNDVHTLATINPLTRVLEAGRGFLAGSPTEVGTAFAVGLALAAAFSLWAFRGLRSAEAAG